VPHAVGFTQSLLFTLLVLAAAASAAADTKYQPRGDRWEGILAEPVSGFEVELLSATIDYAEAPTPVAETFRLRFFLEKSHKTPHLVVRELSNRRYYWLDKVQPTSPWKPGLSNEYAWSTAPVIRPLGDLDISQLGVVVRLDQSKPSPMELVAPAVLFQSRPTQTVAGYRFVFKLVKGGNDLQAQVFADTDLQHPVWSLPLGKKLGETPIPAVWPVDASVARGWYRVVLSGISLGSGQKISQVVRFYHEPASR
jgi:hypothetical protein